MLSYSSRFLWQKDAFVCICNDVTWYSHVYCSVVSPLWCNILIYTLTRGSRDRPQSSKQGKVPCSWALCPGIEAGTVISFTRCPVMTPLLLTPHCLQPQTNRQYFQNKTMSQVVTLDLNSMWFSVDTVVQWTGLRSVQTFRKCIWIVLNGFYLSIIIIIPSPSFERLKGSLTGY